MSIFKRKSGKSKVSQQLKTEKGIVPNGTQDGSVQFDESGFHVSPTGVRPKTLLLPPHQLGSLQPDSDADYNTLRAETPLQTASRLSKTLREIIHDKDALPYFIQYMDSCHAAHYIKFWLDAESFKAATISRIGTHSRHASRAPTATSQKEVSVASNKDDVNMASQNMTSNSSHTDATLCKEDAMTSQKEDIDKSVLCDNSKQGCAINQNSVECGAKSLAQDGSAVAPIPQPSYCDSSRTNIPPSSQPYSCDSSYSVNAHGSSQTGSNRNRPDQTSSHSSSSAHAQDNPAGSAQSSPLSKNKYCSQTQSSVEGPHEGMINPPIFGATAKEGGGALTSDNVVPPVTSAKKESFQEKLRKSIAQDAVNIFQKYISHDASHSIRVPDTLRNETIAKICREDGEVDPKCFDTCQEHVVQLMETQHYQGFLASDYHCKHQIDVLTSTSVYLADILYNESAISYYMEFMEQESAMPLLQCWLDLDSFQQLMTSQSGHVNAEEAQTDAMVLYEKYFSLQATQPLGFEDSIRMEVEGNICREEGPQPDCFTKPKQIVQKTMEKVYFSHFITSQIYYRYLSDLIIAAQSAHTVPHVARKRRDSDCDSDNSVGSKSSASGSVSISSKNTLLAGMDKSGLKKAMNNIEDDMRIDNNLLNPDSLWRRPQAGQMSLGKIDEMGSFVSMFDPEPDRDKKKKGFFTRSADKDKDQEAMALQIAQMIVKDCSSEKDPTQLPDML